MLAMVQRMGAVTQRIDVVGFVPQPCASCNVLTDWPVCDVCGHDHDIVVPRNVAAQPPKPAAPDSHKVSCYDSPICECGLYKIEMGGLLRCPECGDEPILSLKQNRAANRAANQAATTHRLGRVDELELIRPTCDAPTCRGIETRFELIGGEFICECGESAGTARYRGEEANGESPPPEPKAAFAPPSQPNSEPAAALPEAVTTSPGSPIPKKKRR